MVTQVLYGDFFKVLEKRKKWSKIKIAFDGYKGWIDNKQYIEITEAQYKENTNKAGNYAFDLI